MADKDTSSNDDSGNADGATDGDTAPAATDWEAEAKKWREMSRKHEARAKGNATAAEKLEALENASKSDLEKAQLAAAAADKRAQDAELRAMRLEVAGAKGLNPAQAKRLAGSTLEELEADADELLETFKVADTAGTTQGGKPREALRGGASDDDATDEPSIEEVLKAIPRANG